MHEPNSLNNSLKKSKEFKESSKYPFTDGIKLTFADHLAPARHRVKHFCKRHRLMCLLRRSPLYGGRNRGSEETQGIPVQNPSHYSQLPPLHQGSCS